MDKRLCLLFLVCTALGICTECSSNFTPAKIFFINLFHDVVDIRLGQEANPIFHARSIHPFEFTIMKETREFGTHVLFFKSTIQTEWNSWFFADQDNSCFIEPGNIYCLIITFDGTIHFFTMTEDNEPGAKVCFLNGSHSQLSEMIIAADSLENQIVSIQALESNTLSNFYTITAGNYLLFWQQDVQKQRDEFSFYTSNENRDPESLIFNEAHYYVFLVYTGNDAIKARLLDITP